MYRHIAMTAAANERLAQRRQIERWRMACVVHRPSLWERICNTFSFAFC